MMSSRDTVKTNVTLPRSNVPVADLIPGDVVSAPLSDLTAVFVTQCEHPLWPGLQLVIWRQGNPHQSRGIWFHDALSFEQVVGNTWATNDQDRIKALRWALGV